MVHFQNTYTQAASAQTANGRQTTTMDWSKEITAMPEEQNLNRSGSDSGMENMSRDMMSTTRELPGVSRNMTAMRNGTTIGMAASGSQSPQGGVGPRMQLGQPINVLEPQSVDEAYRGSMKAKLAQYVGSYVVATFLVGTQSTVSWEGILFDVGNDFITIYQEIRDRYIVIDIYSLKYIEFYDTQRREMCEALLQQNGWQNNR